MLRKHLEVSDVFSSDPVIDYLHHEMELEEKLNRLPVCALCGYHIQQDMALRLNGDWICDTCISDNTYTVEEVS